MASRYPRTKSMGVTKVREDEETLEREVFHEGCMTRLKEPNRTNCMMTLK